MLNKPLIHERVYPDDPTSSLRFLASAKNESASHGRHFFVNRKQDRFTLSARYAEVGVTEKGKQWARWKTLFTFSITYRQPANSNFPNLNLFYTGAIFGKKIQGVINVTRNPSLVLKGMPIALLKVINDELVNLLERNNRTAPFKAHKGMEEYDVFTDTYNLLQNIAYPLFRETKIAQLTNNPPAFLTALFRSPSIEYVCEYYKVDIKSDLGSYLNENFSTLNPNSLFMLEASQKILSCEDRFKLIKIHELQPYPEALEQGEHFYYWENAGSEIPALRAIFRRAKHEDVMSMLGSEFNDMLQLNDSLKEWRKNSKIVSTSSFKEYPSAIQNFDALSKIMHEEILMKRKDSPHVLGEKIENQIKDFCDFEFLPWEEDTTWSSNFITANVGEYRTSALNKKPIAHKNSTQYSEIYAIHNPSSAPFDKKSVIWGLLKTNDFASLSLSTKAAPLFLTQKNQYQKDNIMLSPVAYSDFLKKLKEYACLDLTKHGLEVTQKNISLYIAVLFIFTKFYQLKKYKGTIPRKFFTLIKAGVKPDMALLFLKKNISVKNAIALKDTPKQWVFKAIGISEDSSELF